MAVKRNQGGKGSRSAPPEPAACIPAVDKNASLQQALVVDDDPLSQQFCCHILRSAGLRVHQAYSGQQALQLARSLDLAATPVVVLMDGQLPDISGPEVLRRWPKKPSSSAVAPVCIGMTADDSAAARDALVQAGCGHVLLKPFAPHALLDLLASTPPRGMATADVARGSDANSEALLQKFTTSLRSDLQALDQALYRQQWQEFRRILHSLSGAAAISGQQRLSGLCRRLSAGAGQALKADSASEFSSAYLQLRQQAADLLLRKDSKPPD